MAKQIVQLVVIDGNENTSVDLDLTKGTLDLFLGSVIEGRLVIDVTKQGITLQAIQAVAEHWDAERFSVLREQTADLGLSHNLTRACVSKCGDYVWQLASQSASFIANNFGTNGLEEIRYALKRRRLTVGMKSEIDPLRPFLPVF